MMRRIRLTVLLVLLVGVTLWQRLLGRPASESGTLRHGDGTHGRSDRCRRSFVLPILQPLSTIIPFWPPILTAARPSCRRAVVPSIFVGF